MSSNETCIKEEYVDILDEYGSKSPLSFQELIPIQGSEQKAKTGFKENMKKQYVGHVAYSPDFDCFVYQCQREQNMILQSIEGKGFAISEQIINNLRNNYNVKYVFGGMRESKNVYVIPLDEFTDEWQTQGWDKQLYATLSTDIEYELNREMTNVFTDRPSDSRKSAPLEKYT